MTATPSFFLNLPVADVDASAAFYTALGFTLNDTFSDDSTKSFVVNEGLVVMIHTHEKFAQFAAGRPVADLTGALAALYAVPAASREAVDTLVDAAVAAGGAAFRDPEDHGFMYGRSFSDLDGHVFETVWMDPTQLPG